MSVDHLLIHCERANHLWHFVFRSFGVSWVLLRTEPDLLFGWMNWLGKLGSAINACLRMWKAWETSCLLHLLVLCLIDLRFGGSHLVIPFHLTTHEVVFQINFLLTYQKKKKKYNSKQTGRAIWPSSKVKNRNSQFIKQNLFH